MLALQTVSAQQLVASAQAVWRPSGAGSVEALGLAANAEGSAVLLSEARFPGGIGGWYLTRFGPQLEVVWNHDLLDPRFAQGAVQALDNGDLLVLGAGSGSLIVQRRAAGSGQLLWQQERALLNNFALAADPPVGAEDSATGRVYFAAASAEDVVLHSVSSSGGEATQQNLTNPDATEQPTAIAMDANGVLAVSSIVADTPGGTLRRYLTWFLGSDGQLLGQDVETGDIGTVFRRPRVIPDPLGGWFVHGGPESQCGVFQTRLWRVDADLQRDWTFIAPAAPCNSWDPIAVAQFGREHLLGSRRQSGAETSFGLALVNASGNLVWDRTWPATQPAGSHTPTHMAADPEGRVFMLGRESGGGVQRPIAAVWNAGGERCMQGWLNDSGMPQALVSTDSGWLLALQIFSAGSSSVHLRRHLPADACERTVFSNGFE